MSDHWTPAQPLRADATDEQMDERYWWLEGHSQHVGVAKIANAMLRSRIAREFAAACVKASREPAPTRDMKADLNMLRAEILAMHNECSPTGREWDAYERCRKQCMKKVTRVLALYQQAEET